MPRLRTLILAFVMMIPPIGDARADDARIGWGWGATIEGFGYWSVYPDDTMQYFGAIAGAEHEMKGWQWTDEDLQEGRALFRSPGVWDRALAVAETARADPVLNNPPDYEPQCLDAGIDDFWLDLDAAKPTFSIDGCLWVYPKTFKQRRYAKRATKLIEDLSAALQTKSVLPD
ncbi:MAG: hypothetical protein KJO15_14540 [Alphaproteobacteria bacterium]|nr:hypothetical protein [Alphaproteobacteria bacterium]